MAETAVKESIRVAEQFLNKLFGPAAEEGGGLIKDKVEFWRFKSKIELLMKTKSFLEEKGIDPRLVLPKTLIPILESGSLENDPTLSDMWANLLASYATGNLEIQSYPFLLRELSPMEVSLLSSLYSARKRSALKGRDLVTHGVTSKSICGGLGISEERYGVMVDNLFRLNLVQPVGATGALVGEHPISIKTNEIIYLTDLGFDFVKVCTEFSDKNSAPVISDEGYSSEKGPGQDNAVRWG